MNFYETQTFDYTLTKGDTLNLKFEFKKKDTLDAINITGWDSKFTLTDPITKDPLLTLQKTHNDGIAGGDGIYYNGDTEAPAGLNIDTTNKLVVILTYEDTSTLETGVYPFDLEFTVGVSPNIVKYTAVKGNLIITEEDTPSV